MSALTFSPAVRKCVKLKALVTGPSGSGKTFGALALATAMAPGKVAVIDSEHDRSEYYADAFQFDRLSLPDLKMETYVAALHAAVSAGYEVVVIDSLSHAWEELLDRKSTEERNNPRANGWTLWAKYGEQWADMIRAMLEAPVHVVCTARSKMAYEQTTNDKGKKEVNKLGMAPILRDGTEYEFAIVFDLLISHAAMVSKDNTQLFDSREYYDLTDSALAQKLKAWLNGGAEVAPRLAPEPAETKWTAPRPEPSRVLEPLNAITAGELIAPPKLGGKPLKETSMSQLRALVKWASDKTDLSQETQRIVSGAALLITYRESEAKAAEAAAAVGAESEDVVARLTAAVEADDAEMPF